MPPLQGPHEDVWDKDCGTADVYMDGTLDRKIDAYYFGDGVGNPFAYLYHHVALADGEHTCESY